MRKYIFIILVLALSIYIAGCSKKQESIEEVQEPISMEALSTNVPESKPEPLPPAGPYKPKAFEIQTALKNAGFYTGEIDGKIGPLTRKAVEEFQKANGLQVDGKVGLKTWAILSKYLSPELPSKPSKKR